MESASSYAVIAGPAACLTAASLWAVAVTLFRVPIRDHGARSVNLVKCLLAACLQGATVLALGQAGAIADSSSRALLFLVASGLVGLTLGDTALFGAVARSGVHVTLLLQTLAPVFTALIALVWRGERPGGNQAWGALLILLGVIVVVAPRWATWRTIGTRLGDRPDAGSPAYSAGIALGIVSAFGQGCGIVLAKEGMVELPVVAASFVRLGAAALGLLVLNAGLRRLGRAARLVRSPAALGRAVPATLLGTYLALFLMMAGVAWSPAAVAAVLLSTSPIFSLFIESVVDRKPLTVRGVGGTLLAVAGVAVLTLRG